MSQSLVVVRPFAAYAPGDVIEAEGAMRAVLNGEHALHVVRVERLAAATGAAPPASAAGDKAANTAQEG